MPRSRTLHLVAAIGLCLGMPVHAPAAAAQGIAPSFTLADALQRARLTHPLLAAAGGRRESVTGAARQDGALLNPTLEWRKENLDSPLARDEFLTAGVQVDTYGRRFALRAASAATGRRALADSVTTAHAVEYDIARAYWRAALSAAVHAATIAQREVIDTIARIEEERARQGAVPEGAALRARLEADRAHLAEVSAGAEFARAHGDLARALALPYDSVPTPTESVRVDTIAAVPPLATLLATAHAQRPELASARARVTEAQRRQLAERLGALPGIGFQIGSKRTSGYQTGTVQVGMAIPLFDRNAGGRQRAHGDLLVAESELRSAEASVNAEVTASLRALLTLRSAYARVPGAVALSDLGDRGRVVADITAAAYREGAAPLFELLDAERVRADVRLVALRAAADVHLARLDLNRALGLAADGTSHLMPAK